MHADPVLMNRQEAAVAFYANHFISEGPEYVRGFLDAHNRFTKWLKRFACNEKFLGAQFAHEHFKRSIPAIS